MTSGAPEPSAPAPVPAQRRHHERVDPHVRGRSLSDVVLGAQDGLVNTLGIVLGVAAASAEGRVTFAAGAAAAIAEAISLAAVAYTSTAARGDLFEAERARERRHVATVPELEKDEIRRIYAAKGFEGELLEKVVDTICANEEVWIAVMMAEEHRLEPVDGRTSLRSAVVVGVASLFGSFLPVLPFGFLPLRHALVAALVAGALGLFALGAYKAKVTGGAKGRGGLVLAGIGLASAVAGYLVGRAFG